MKNISNNEYQRILMNRLSYQNKLAIKLISELILQGRVNLEEVPQSFRIMNREIYISSLRLHRNNCNSLIKDLKLILSDIGYAELDADKDSIMYVLSYNFQYLEINYLGDKQIEDFKKSIPKEILQKLSIQG